MTGPKLVFKERNKVFFNLYESVFILLKEQYGEAKALELMTILFERNLGEAYGTNFKKGDPNEFARVISGHDTNVGLHIEFPKISENEIVYRFTDDVFPGLKGLVDPEKLAACYMPFKIRYVLGPDWKYKTTKHFWKGDNDIEHIIYK